MRIGKWKENHPTTDDRLFDLQIHIRLWPLQNSLAQVLVWQMTKSLRLTELARQQECAASAEIELARLRSHERLLGHIYGLRWGGLGLSALTIAIGAVMVFQGLQGSFNWAVEAPHSIAAKLTNASPGIVFATIGLVIAFVVLLQATCEL